MSVYRFVCIFTCCNKTGSRAGSNSSPTFSRRQGLPKRMACSRVRRKSRSLNFITSNPLSCSWLTTKYGTHRKIDKNKLWWWWMIEVVTSIKYPLLPVVTLPKQAHTRTHTTHTHKLFSPCFWSMCLLVPEDQWIEPSAESAERSPRSLLIGYL